MAEPPTLPDAVRASNSMPLCLGTMSADEWRCAAPARAFGGPWALNRQQPEGGRLSDRAAPRAGIAASRRVHVEFTVLPLGRLQLRGGPVTDSQPPGDGFPVAV